MVIDALVNLFYSRVLLSNSKRISVLQRRIDNYISNMNYSLEASVVREQTELKGITAMLQKLEKQQERMQEIDYTIKNKLIGDDGK